MDIKRKGFNHFIDSETKKAQKKYGFRMGSGKTHKGELITNPYIDRLSFKTKERINFAPLKFYFLDIKSSTPLINVSG